MPTLNVSVVDKIATGDGQIIVCDNTDYTVKFNLDAEWGEYNAKTMRVIYPDNNYEDTLFTGDECPLPRLYNVNSIRIGIYAGDLHATAVAVFECRKSVLSEEGQHVQPPEDIYNQIMDAIENGALDGVGIDHIDKTATAGLVDTYTIYYTDETTSTFEVTNGSSIASVAKTSTSGNVDTYTITMTDGTTSTFTVTNGSVTSVDGMTGDIVLDNKANIDGSYDGMTVGSAQQLLASSGVEDKAPYAYRTSSGSMDIGDREELNEINGMTVAWNQLANYNMSSATQNGITFTNNGDGSITANGTATAIARYTSVENANIQAVQNHVYYLTGCPTGGSNATYKVVMRLFESANSRDVGNGAVFKYTDANMILRLQAVIGTNTTVTDLVFRPQIFDLTAMFGATVADYVYSLERAQAGAGVAWFRGLFPNSFYAYSAPTLMSVKTTGHKTVGFNAYNPTTGSAKVIGNNAYQITGTYTAISLDGQTITPDSNGIFTPTANGTLTVTGGNDTDTCIHLVWSGTRNGEYEAYKSNFYPLDSTLELRGIPKLDSNNKLYADGDIYTPSGGVTRRYGIVDLGSLTWVNVASNTMLRAAVPLMNRGAIITSAPYEVKDVVYTSLPDKSITSFYLSVTSTPSVMVKDSTYAGNPSGFKTAMSGVYLVYELATPTTETADPYQQTQVVNDWGTEEFIDSRDVAIPVGHKTNYLPNLRDKLQHLPSLASDDGYYLISQQNNTMSLELFRIPKAPSEDGTYQLKATVTSGTPTYFWEAIV